MSSLLLHTVTLSASEKVIRSFSINDGISSNRVYSIAQDAKGFIWIGTNYGLNRFDGVTFKKYHYNSADPNSISSNNIRDLLIDRNGKMWLALDNGVNVYDPQSDSFSKFDTTTDKGESISTRTIDITEDHDGEIWISSYSEGIFRYNPATEKLTRYYHVPDAANSIPSSKYVKLCVDKNNKIWIATYNQGVIVYDKSSDTFTHYGPDQLGDTSVNAICEDSYGNIWLGTFQNGLVMYDYDKDRFSRYPANDQSLYHIQTITEIRPGELLIGSDSGTAVFCMDKCSIATDEAHSSLLSNNNKFIYSAYIDNRGGVWLGSYFDGLEYYSSQGNIFTNHTTRSDQNGKVVNCIAGGKDGTLWIGTDDNGIARYSTSTGKTIYFKDAQSINSSYYCVRDIICKNNRLYVATYERGFEIIDLPGGARKQYLPSNSNLPSARVYTLHDNNNGRIYIGSTLGLCYYDESSASIKTTEISSHVVALVEDDGGNIWVATATDGVWQYNQRNNSYKQYTHSESQINSLPRNTLTTITKDENNTIWIGTDGYGLCAYVPQTDSFQRYTDLELPNNAISAILPERNYLWIATGNGLARWDRKSNRTKVYNNFSGISNSQFSLNAGLRGASGTLFFGTSDGFISFNPDQLNVEPDAAHIVLTGFKISNQTITPATPDSPLKNSIENTSEIVLSYRQSNVELSFADLNYDLFNPRSYRYMLNDYDQQWHYVDSGNHRIGYTNLPSGNHELIMQVADNNGAWVDTDLKLHLVIKPHFLLSKVAVGIYVLLIMAICFVAYKALMTRAMRENELRIKDMQKRKEQEIYDAKIEFFTSIAHEIRTPLSLIVGPLEYIKKSRNIIDQYGEYLSIIEQNHKRLLVLVNQLLDFRKIDSGKYTLNYSTCNISNLLYDITSRFDMLLHQKEIRLHVRIEPSDLTANTDAEALTKVVSNLITNAIKHTKSELSITVLLQDGQIRFEVQDDGMGIPGSEQTKIFNPFYQVKNGKVLNNGVGIGLYMSQSLIALLGGKIEVSDRADGKSGALFRFVIPVNGDAPESATAGKTIDEYIVQTGENTDPVDTPKPDMPRNKTVMLVDDDSEILNFLGKIMSQQFFTISATSGEDALHIMNTNDVDVIISDVMMDGMNGLELCKIVKSSLNTSHIPFIMLTAKSDIRSKIEGLEYGADAYIEKPFSPDYLLTQVNSLLRQREELKKKYASVPLSEIKLSVSNKLDAEFAEKCSAIIRENISDSEFSIDVLARELNLGRTMLFQKIKAISGMTPNDFVKTVRLKRACELMVEGEHRINEIGFMVGFTSSSYFAKCFSKQFGMLPTQFVVKLKNGELDG